MSGIYPRRMPWVGKQLVPPSSPPAAVWALRQSALAGGVSVPPYNLSFTSNVLQGDLLLGWIAMSSATGKTVSCSDSQGNTYATAVLTSVNATDNSIVQCFFAIAGASGPNTLTFTPSSGTPPSTVVVEEFTPGGTPTAFTITKDGTNSAVFTTNTGTPSAGTIPVNNPNELVVVGLGQTSAPFSGTITPGGALVTDQQRIAAPTFTTAYVLSANAGVAGSFTTSQNRAWDVAGVSFRAV